MLKKDVIFMIYRIIFSCAEKLIEMKKKLSESLRGNFD